MSQTELVETDVLIIGMGIAGSTVALQLADAGINVTVITRASEPEESNTFYAQGGIIYKGENDSHEKFAQDIYHAGAHLNYPKAVNVLAENGARCIEEILIKKVGVPFDKSGDNLERIKEAAHSSNRIIHATDMTGRAIQTALIKYIIHHPKINLITDHAAIDLITPGHHSINKLRVYEPNFCVGAYILDIKSGQVKRFLARKIVLATGGLGQIFLHTTNPRGARGDGIAMVHRAHGKVINAEYIQFHPTTFYHKLAPRSLISEAVRGAGAILINEAGEAFMSRYDAEWKDLAPRDVVARSIHSEMLHSGQPNVYLDLASKISPHNIEKKFPAILDKLLQFGVDIRKDLVPVTPAAHYSCGGVAADTWGMTTIRNLYAVGEVACTGVHGANRLGSSSLLEGLVWGDRCAQHIRKHISKPVSVPEDEIPPWEFSKYGEPDPVLIQQDMNTIKQVMWNYVGLVRTPRRLKRAMRELRNLEAEIDKFYRVSKITDALIGLRNAVRVAFIVTTAALHNKESRGCHYREED